MSPRYVFTNGLVVELAARISIPFRTCRGCADDFGHLCRRLRKMTCNFVKPTFRVSHTPCPQKCPVNVP